MDLNRFLARLVRLKPASRAAGKLRMQGEQALMKMLNEEGLMAVQRIVARRPGLAPVNKAPGTRTWREELGDRAIQVHVTSNRFYKATSITYVEVPKLTAADLERDAVQKRYYERYMAIGRRAYADPPGRISAMERRLLLVGEFEADVNNGVFSQYLFNKGARRARTALAALKAIGARRTAAMLEAAMKPGVTEARLSALDDRFYKVPEDLAVLAARHARL